MFDLNQAIKEKLNEFNQKEFQKKSGSRVTAFLEEEKFALLPLPASPYELAKWKKATVQYDYHILVDKMYYSVPYEDIKHEVDWAGQTAFLKDRITGEAIPAYVFVAALPCSQYAYVEACLSMDTENWISAHIRAFKHFGGVTQMIVPDNLKTGVVKASSTDPIINQSYQEMAEYYHTAIMPARVRRPKDYPQTQIIFKKP